MAIFLNIWMIGKIFNECLSHEKEDFYSKLNVEDVAEPEKGFVKILRTNFG